MKLSSGWQCSSYRVVDTLPCWAILYLYDVHNIMYHKIYWCFKVRGLTHITFGMYRWFASWAKYGSKPREQRWSGRLGMPKMTHAFYSNVLNPVGMECVLHGYYLHWILVNSHLNTPLWPRLVEVSRIDNSQSLYSKLRTKSINLVYL